MAVKANRDNFFKANIRQSSTLYCGFPVDDARGNQGSTPMESLQEMPDQSGGGGVCGLRGGVPALVGHYQYGEILRGAIQATA